MAGRPSTLRRRAATLALAAAALLAACGGSDGGAGAATSSPPGTTTTDPSTTSVPVTSTSVALAATTTVPLPPPTDGDPATLRCGGVAIGLLAPTAAPEPATTALVGEVERGIALALAAFHRDHPGCAVELVRFDPSGPGGASGVARDAAGTDRVLGVIGPITTSDTGALNPLASADLVAVSPTITDPQVTTGRFGAFRRIARRGGDAEGAAGLADWLRATQGTTTAAVVDDGSEEASQRSDDVDAELTRAGATVVDVPALIGPEQTDLGDTVEAAIAAGVDTVVYAGDPALGGRLAKQLHDSGSTAEVVGAWGVHDRTFLDLAGGAGEGALAVSWPAPVRELPSAALFVEDYRLAYHPAQPGPFAAEAYDAASVLLDAIASGAVTRPQVQAHLEGLSFAGITGPLVFGEDGEASGGLYVSQVQAGRWVPAARLP